MYAIFAITFVMRPVGSWFFGRFADRRGRRAALTISVSVMAACSMVVALVPSQQSIGIAAPIILIVARLVQGFATGGEYGTSATYMSEAATRERRGFFSSFQYVTLVGGHVLAQFTLLIVDSFLNDEQMHEFGWRIGFAVGRRRRGGGVLAPPHDGRIAVRGGHRGRQGGRGQGRRLDAHAVHDVLEAAAAVLPDHAGWNGGFLHLQRQRAGDRQDRIQVATR